MKPLLIGQAPGPNTDPKFPLYPLPITSSGGRLCVHMGISIDLYLEEFSKINLLPKYTGKWGNGDKFSIKDAKLAALILKKLSCNRKLILVGKEVSKAFDHGGISFFKWKINKDYDYKFVVIPHPSGRNHWYNDKNNKLKSNKFWNKFFEEID